MRMKEKIVFEIKNKIKIIAKFFASNQKCIVAASLALFMIFVGIFGLVEYLVEAEDISQNALTVNLDDLEDNGNENVGLVESLEQIVIREQAKMAKVSFSGGPVLMNPVNRDLSFNPAITPLIMTRSSDSDKKDIVESCPVSYAKSISQLEKNLQESSPFDLEKTVYQMYINGEVVATFSSPDDAKQVVDKIVAEKTDKNAKLIDVDYKENVNIKKTDLSFLAFDDFSNVDETVDFLMTGTKEKKEYSIKAGDIPETIAESNGMTLEELEKANPSIVGRGHLLQIGEKLNLVVPVPMLNVLTTEKQEYKDNIKYQTVKEEDSEMYEGESVVKIAGVDGQRQVVAEVKRENGVEVNRKIVSEVVLSEPTSEVLIVGTKKAPPRKGTGVFDVPISRGYIVSSEFGPRWGGMHTGIDLACSTGTPILAADGGQVISSGWDGSYGYAVVIDHGGNMVTKYAHCSALHVSEGEMVFKGQHIADVGSTGRSTGSHLHFEVIKNGSFMNPRYYIFGD